MGREISCRRLRIVTTDGGPPDPVRAAMRRAAWHAHRQALAIGRLIERHHATAATLQDGTVECCVRDYRAAIRTARDILDRLDTRLAALDP